MTRVHTNRVQVWVVVVDAVRRYPEHKARKKIDEAIHQGGYDGYGPAHRRHKHLIWNNVFDHGALLSEQTRTGE